jgi:hypothetical protein
MTLFLILVFHSFCQISYEKENTHTPVLNKFENIAYITLDSCKNWGLPSTQFKIEYPNGFIAEYNADSKYYLRLRKFTNNKVSKEITIGKSGVTNREGTEFWLKKLDKGLASQFENYKLLFLGEKQFLDSTCYILQCQVNFDKFKDSKFLGDYHSSTVILLPPNNKLNGVSINILQSATLTESKEEIMSTFNFSY